jgi:nucleoside-diphosphate-sugar epimerase
MSFRVANDISADLRYRSTGVTGYIAGDCLCALSRAHPEYEISALVRSQDKADIVSKAYPSVRIVLGGLDDSDLLKQEAARADIILRTPLNHISENQH